MSKPPDPLPRPTRLDPDAMFAALDRVVNETPIGIPRPAFPDSFEPTPIEPVETLFATERDLAPETVEAAPARQPIVETSAPPDPIFKSEQVVKAAVVSEPVADAAARPDPIVEKAPPAEVVAKAAPLPEPVVATPVAPEPVVEAAALRQPVVERAAPELAAPLEEEVTEFAAEPTVIPREDRPWSAWQERRRRTQPEPIAEPASRARSIAAAPAAAPEMPPPVAPPPPTYSRSATLFSSDPMIADEPVEAAASPDKPLRMVWAAVIVLAVLVAAQGLYIVRSRSTAGAGSAAAAAAGVQTGTVHIESTPPGATIVWNGQERGVTPAALSLAPGDYQLEIEQEGRRQPLAVTVRAGRDALYRVVLPETPRVGGVSVSSQPPGVPVTIDGKRRGVTPLSVSDLAPGEHTVAVEGASGSVQNKVAVLAGAVSSVMVTLPTTPAAAATAAPVAKATATSGTAVGWVTVDAPTEINLIENGKLVGTSRMDRIMLPAGRHQLEAVNETLGYRSPQTVTVNANGGTRLRIELPTSKVSVNAIPWADVWIDGKSAGQTPLGNLSLPIGTHEVVMRHPQLGERKQTVTVTTEGPNRVSAVFNR